MSDANILFPTIGFALGVAFGYAFRSLLASEDMAELQHTRKQCEDMAELQHTRKQCEEMSESMYRPVPWKHIAGYPQRDYKSTGVIGPGLISPTNAQVTGGFNIYHQST